MCKRAHLTHRTEGVLNNFTYIEQEFTCVLSIEDFDGHGYRALS